MSAGTENGTRPLTTARKLTKVLHLDPTLTSEVLGIADQNLRVIEQALTADIHVRGSVVTLTGSETEIALAEKIILDCQHQASRTIALTPETVERTIAMLTTPHHTAPNDSVAARNNPSLGRDIIARRGKRIRAKTTGQQTYVNAIENHTIVFGLGPAGTGKTYLAMAKAVAALHDKSVSRIILTRPAVEAGERLGFLPGTLHEKIDPYLRPLYDSLHDMMDPEVIAKFMESGVIEVAPLAYMRGRTLNDAFIILDEAQNTTPEQMKMFLTRLGFGSKVVVTGDITQVDLPGGNRSGLKVVRDILTNIEDIHFAQLTSDDVVRHRLVAKIVDAYEAHDEKKRSASHTTARTARR